jgi:RNA polymerase sigma-70 factor, ECF subfamily
MDQPKPGSDDTDQLLEKANAGDKRAFEDLFERHRAYLLKVVTLRFDQRFRRRFGASDVVQEAHAQALERIRDYLTRRPMAFRLWLRMIAVDQLSMLERRHRANRRTVDREVHLPDNSAFVVVQQMLAAASSPSNRLERSETARLIREAVDQLSDSDREILLLRNLEGLSNQEAAETLQIEPVAASQRYGRALRRLHQMLHQKGLLGARA